MGNIFCGSSDDTTAVNNANSVGTLENHLRNLNTTNIPDIRYLPHHFKTWGKVSKILSNPPADIKRFDEAMQDLDSVASYSNATTLTAKKAPKPGFYSNALLVLFQQENDLEPIFFEEIIPHMCQAVLNLPTLFPKACIEVLMTQKEGTREFTRTQAHALLCCQFFNLFAHIENLRDCTFWYILNQRDQMFKLRCLVNYFLCVSRGVGPSSGTVKVSRHVISITDALRSFSDDALLNNKDPISKMKASDGKIEEQENCAHTDFANKAIGGGVLRGGCVQEEIMFMICPECLISMIMCPNMDANESIRISGFTQYSSYSGYSRRTKWVGKFGETVDDHPEESCAIDALMHPMHSQYTTPFGIRREILKAYIGFRDLEHDNVATGNWGSGAFGGDPQLKLFLQWIAASLAKKDVIYCKFTDRRMVDTEKVIAATPTDLTIGQLYKLVLTTCEQSGLAEPDNDECSEFFSEYLDVLHPPKRED